jgi:hypothetical protein
MLKRMNSRWIQLALCVLIVTSAPTHAKRDHHRRDQSDDHGRWLYSVRGTTEAVAYFLQLYKAAYDANQWPLRVACDFPTTVNATTLLFVCDVGETETQDQINAIFNVASSKYPAQSPAQLEMAITAASSCTGRRCAANPTAGCSYYQGPGCLTPGCYHTNYYCVGQHSCPP